MVLNLRFQTGFESFPPPNARTAKEVHLDSHRDFRKWGAIPQLWLLKPERRGSALERCSDSRVCCRRTGSCPGFTCGSVAGKSGDRFGTFQAPQ